MMWIEAMVLLGVEVIGNFAGNLPLHSLKHVWRRDAYPASHASADNMLQLGEAPELE